ncbi:MAG: serine O-acetyltransferase [Thermoanaerobaculia bacterium]
MFENLLADTRRLRDIKTKRAPWYVVESVLFENGYQAVILHRLAHWFRRRRIPVMPALLHKFAIAWTGADIAPAAEIGPGLLIGHGVGLVIGNRVQIGAQAHFVHGVTIGGSSPRQRAAMPTLGERVFVGAHAAILGPIHVGDGCFIGANAVVTADVPAGSKVVALPSSVSPPRPAAEP